MAELVHLGLDVGSTTVKLVALNINGKIIYSKYMRHYSNIKESIYNLLLDGLTNFTVNVVS